MRLEFLADAVALALDRFAILGGDAGEAVEPGVDGGDERVAMVEVAGLAGAEIAIAIGVGDGRGATVRIDPRDHLCAFVKTQEITLDEEGEILAGHPLDAWMAGDPGRVGVRGGGR